MVGAMEVLSGSPPGPRVQRTSTAKRPDQSWAADLSGFATCAGLVYVAFVIDVFMLGIVGCHVSRSLHTHRVLDVLDQTLGARQRARGLLRLCDRGCQNRSIHIAERLAEADIDSPVRSGCAFYDSTLRDTIVGLHKTDATYVHRPIANFAGVEYTAPQRVNWSNYRNPLEPIGRVPPAEHERGYHRLNETSGMAA
jgi:putative transposase